MAYATEVYKVTSELPWFEKKGLCNQLQRAAASISPNITEGAAKPSDVEFAKFLDAALGLAFELETQLTIANDVGYINNELFNSMLTSLSEIEKQLNGPIHSLRSE